MSYDGKIATDRWYPVTCYNTSMSGIAGVTAGSISVKYGFENGALVAYSPTSNWNNRSSGQYELQIGASEWTNSGLYRVLIHDNSGVFVDHVFTVEVKPLYNYEMVDRIVSIYNALPVSNGKIASSGSLQSVATNVLTIDNVLDTVSGDLDTFSTVTATRLNTISGYTDSLEAGQTTINITLNTISGFTDTLESSQATMDTKLNVISGYTDSLESGQTTMTTALNTISGYTYDLPNIDTIVASGNAANWSGVPTDFTTDTSVSGLLDNLLTKIYDEVVTGVSSPKTFKESIKEIVAYTAGGSTRDLVTGAITYQDPDSSGFFTLTPLLSGRLRS